MSVKSPKLIFIFLWSVVYPFCLSGQTDTIAPQNIPLIEVKALRIESSWLKSPIVISSYTVDRLSDARPQMSLQEYLGDIPGIFSLNAYNYAQDLRISIRGFGSRSAFGIRGVKIIVDGIPETTPDGQGQIDNLNLGAIQSLQVIKGPASVLYGNASGGVIQIQTIDQIAGNFAEVGLFWGAFQTQQYQFKAGLQKAKTTFIFQGNYLTSNGYRVQSGVQSSNFNARLIHRFSSKSQWSWQANYTASPLADDPGALLLSEVVDNPQQARDQNLRFQTGEAISQFKLGNSFKYQPKPNSEFQTYAFYSNRDFSGKQPFESGGIIDLNRHYLGHGSTYQWTKIRANGVNKLALGYELAYQRDDRRRFDNLEGLQGTLIFDQIESFTNGAVYLLDHFSFSKWVLTAGIRYDWNWLRLQDRFLGDGENSGSIFLPALNPSIGLAYSIRPYLSAYANYRTGFETPALSELSANPLNTPGFNSNLKAQQARNLEIGIKRQSLKWILDLAYFHIDTRNELVPFELEAFPGRSFFRNAGATRRDGLELGVHYAIQTSWSFSLAYTFSNFIFIDYTLPNGDFSGKQLPGIPRHLASFTLARSPKRGWDFQLQGRLTSDLYTNDANEIIDPAYFLLRSSVAYRLQRQHYLCTPFLGIQNLLNQTYNDNIRINAFGNRFYEPGPKLYLYGGIRFRWNNKLSD